MKEVLILSVLLVCIGLIFPGTARAGYLDPGSGSILVQGIVSFLAAIGRLKAKITGFFGSQATKG